MSSAASHHDDGPAIELVDDFSRTIAEPPEPASHGAGPVVTDADYQRRLDELATHPAIQGDNVRLDPAKVAGLRTVMLAIGGVGLALTLLGALAVNPAHALASFEVGVFTVLACCLGSLGLVMILHSFNAVWSAAIRRALEAAMALTWLPFAGLLVIAAIEMLTGGILMSWLRENPEENYLLGKKAAYLNTGAFLLRVAIYGVAWIGLTHFLNRWSTEQDVTGDRNLTRKMRRMSGWGLLVFALTVAFAAFDFLMSLDFRFFSTMWGVYYFAGAAMSAAALCALTLAVLRTFGRLNGVVTSEHFHDVGKILFAFTIFWAYIAFSQYFLIWYSNIPEETMWYIVRKSGGWQILGTIICVGHFIVPFFILISRKTKRSTLGLAAMAVFLLLMQVLDMTYIIRPMVYNVAGADRGVPTPAHWWLDLAGVVGVLGVFGWAYLGQLAAHPLVPVRDPRLAGSLKHKNYV